MRVTELGMMQRAADAMQRAQEATNEGARALTSGQRVARPSQDPVAWSDAARAQLRDTAAVGHQSAIDRATSRVSLLDQSLDAIVGVLARAEELGVQFANDTYSAADRAAAVPQLTILGDQALSAANARDVDGEYLLAGSLGGAAPFDAAGVYSGDAQTRSVEVGDGSSLSLRVTGADLTVAAGVDVFQSLSALGTALAANDGPGIRGSLTALGSAIDQIAAARSKLGAQLRALETASAARADLQIELARVKEIAVGADPVAAATELQRHQTAYSAAQVVATRLNELFGKR